MAVTGILIITALYIMPGSEVIECGSFTFKTQVVTEMPSAGPQVKLRQP